MPEMLRINDEVNRLIISIQLNLRLCNGYHVSKIEVVCRALTGLAAQLDVPLLVEDDRIDENE